MYVEEMLPWELDQDELIRLERVVRRRSEGQWPNAMQLGDYAKRVAHRPETEPIFRTMRDDQGRCYAKPTRYRHEVVPDEATLERWKAEAATPEEAREIWNRQFYLTTGRMPGPVKIAEVEVTPEKIINIEAEKNNLTPDSDREQSAPYADRADFDPGPENPRDSDYSDATEFEFSDIEVEVVDEPPDEQPDDLEEL